MKTQQIKEELTEIKRRLATLESKFNIQTGISNNFVCEHDAGFKTVTEGERCEKCNMLVTTPLQLY